MSGKSFAVSPLTMPAALAAADAVLGERHWSADREDDRQVDFLDAFRRRAGAAHLLPVRGHATQIADDHVAWLRKEGWDAQVTQGTPNDVFLAAVLDVTARWRGTGHAFRHRGVDRVLLGEGVLAGGRGPHPVVSVATTDQRFSFLFQQVDRAPSGVLELSSVVLDAATSAAHGRTTEVQLDFPMVDLTYRDDARYMIGVRSGENVVTQAAEQIRLELDDLGGRARAVAEVAVTRSSSMLDTVRIDGPFVVAVVWSGAPDDRDAVVLAAYVDRDAWRKPPRTAR